MRLIFTDPRRPRDVFVINGLTVREGETIDVSAAQGQELLAAHAPRLRAIEEPVKAAAEKQEPKRPAAKRSAAVKKA